MRPVSVAAQRDAAPPDPTLGNALLQAWPDRHLGLPPFSEVRTEHFEPAFQVAMRRHREELDAMAASAAPPTFDNTVVRFDAAGRLYKRIRQAFENLAASHTTPALQAVERAMAEPMAAHDNAVYMHAAFFARLDALHRAQVTPALSTEQCRMLERLHLDFVRAGARLTGAAQQRFAAIEERLAQLSTQFGQNVLADENGWHLELRGEADFAGLPVSVREATKQAGEERGLPGPIVTLSRSLVVPFLSFSERRDLREQVWRAWTTRGEHPGVNDNRSIAHDILTLRAEKARLLGYETFADYALADSMALAQPAVNGLLADVWARAKQAVELERAQLQAVQSDMTANATDGAAAMTEIEAWDWRFWAEKVRQRFYALDDGEIKPYFSLERMAAAAFECAERLFNIHFALRPDLPTYHPDVLAYEVRDATTQRLVGVFLHDNFSRPSKRSGAWMNGYRWQSSVDGVVTPVIVNNNNFNKAPQGESTLLSFDDVRTLFHEFGHGLHGLLSSVTFERLSGTHVLRDFVELPSQLFEHWAMEPEVLRRHARHVHTQAPIPDALIDKLRAARTFGQGFETVRYVASALTDMAVHALPLEHVPSDVVAFEAQVLRHHGLPPGIGINHRFTHFQHLFTGDGYAAGYYVYLWAEVLDADAFTAFEEAGDPFDAAVAARLKTHIYSVGNSVEPGATYAAFRGRAPRHEPMLQQRGLLTTV